MFGDENIIELKVDQTALHGIILGIGFYILVLLFGIFCVRGFYMVQTNDAEIISMGVDYLTVICVFGFGQMFQLIFEKILQSTGRTSYTMVMQMVGAYSALIGLAGLIIMEMLPVQLVAFL